MVARLQKYIYIYILGQGSSVAYSQCVSVSILSQGKASPPSMMFNRLFSDIKEEPGHPTLVHPRYYTFDQHQEDTSHLVVLPTERL